MATETPSVATCSVRPPAIGSATAALHSTTGGSMFVGAISGTSVDGLDLALVAIDNDTIALTQSETVALPSELRERLLELGQPHGDNLDTLGATDRALGEFIGTAVHDFLARCHTPLSAVTAIGSHGQTVRHRPRGQYPFTLQIGDPNQIAELTGITCVADFRRRDMAAGGEGAPLVPPFHAALFQNPALEQVVLNIGGIANVSRLPADPDLPVTGFDTGPGNALLDSWIARGVILVAMVIGAYVVLVAVPTKAEA